jgi:hypothetical protein
MCESGAREQRGQLTTTAYETFTGKSSQLDSDASTRDDQYLRPTLADDEPLAHGVACGLSFAGSM